MITISMRRILAPALGLFFLPGIVTAQQADPQALPAIPAEVEAMLNEFQEVHLKLENIQLLALRDPQLSRTQEELGTEIREAMEARDPGMEERFARVGLLETEAASAQQSGDLPRLQEIIAEAQQIEERFIAVQQEVVSQPAMAQKIASFQSLLERKMIEVDPQAEALIVRFRELETALEAAMQAGA